MLRSEIVSGTHALHAALRICGIREVLESFASSQRADKKTVASQVLAMFQKYQHESLKFGTAERPLVTIFDLEAIEQPAFRALLLSEGDEVRGSSPAWDLHRNVVFATEYLPKIGAMIQHGNEGIPTNETQRPFRQEDTILETMTVKLFEEQTQSSPRRLILMLEAVQSVYEGCAKLHKERENTLSVLRCDSGSDKSFDFLGLRGVLKEVRQIVLDLWDRIIFFVKSSLRNGLI